MRAWCENASLLDRKLGTFFVLEAVSPVAEFWLRKHPTRLAEVVSALDHAWTQVEQIERGVEPPGLAMLRAEIYSGSDRADLSLFTIDQPAAMLWVDALSLALISDFVDWELPAHIMLDALTALREYLLTRLGPTSDNTGDHLLSSRLRGEILTYLEGLSGQQPDLVRTHARSITAILHGALPFGS